MKVISIFAGVLFFLSVAFAPTADVIADPCEVSIDCCGSTVHPQGVVWSFAICDCTSSPCGG